MKFNLQSAFLPSQTPIPKPTLRNTMTKPQDLASHLSAAGVTPIKDSFYHLATDGNHLILKEWKDSSYGDRQLISTSVRPNSKAVFLATPEIETRLVVAISSSNTLYTVKYDEDQEEWTSDTLFGTHSVHPESKLAAFLDQHGNKHVFFQDSGGDLVYLPGSTATVTIPVKAVTGSPLVIGVQDGKARIYYVSSIVSQRYALFYLFILIASVGQSNPLCNSRRRCYMVRQCLCHVSHQAEARQYSHWLQLGCKCARGILSRRGQKDLLD